MNTTHTPEVTGGLTVGAIAAGDYRKAAIFGKYNIDFCCGGNITLEEAATQAGITTADLIAELDAVTQSSALPAAKDLINQEVDTLIRHIVLTHHQYVKENSPVIEQLVTRVAKVHGQEHPELRELEAHTLSFLNDLQFHLRKEEHVLFPAIMQLQQLKAAPAQTTDLIRNAVNMMRTEHASAGEELHTFRTLTNDYALPADACSTYRLLFDKMKEFEADLLTHTHMENNILFPKAIALGN